MKYLQNQLDGCNNLQVLAGGLHSCGLLRSWKTVPHKADWHSPAFGECTIFSWLASTCKSSNSCESPLPPNPLLWGNANLSRIGAESQMVLGFNCQIDLMWSSNHGREDWILHLLWGSNPPADLPHWLEGADVLQSVAPGPCGGPRLPWLMVSNIAERIKRLLCKNAHLSLEPRKIEATYHLFFIILILILYLFVNK